MTGVTIENVYPASPQEWDDTWAACSYATCYQSREWAEIYRIYSGGNIKPRPEMIAFSDGKKALLPFSRKKYLGGIFNQYISSLPHSTPGGWISADDLDIEHGQVLYRFIDKKYNSLMWYLNPHDDIVGKLKIPKTPTQPHHIIKTDKPYKDCYKHISRTQRGSINKAKREGVTVRNADSICDWKNMFAVYDESVKRWGSNAVAVKKWRLFELIYSLQPANMKAWVAEYQTEIIGGLVMFLSKNIVTPWTLNTREKYFTLCPSSLLYEEMIKFSCENGYKSIDLGMSNNIQGLIKFKERFGAIPYKAYKIIKYPKYFRYTRKSITKLRKVFKI